MKKLEEIGFYTLSDKRAKESNQHTPLWRCEMVLTDRCNFQCPYCRGLREDIRGDLDLQTAKKTLEIWIKEKLQNVRFTGGEPTLYKGLVDLVKQAKRGGVKRIAVSTNGSRSKKIYNSLIKAGVNDFSISLDSGCCSVGDKMTGGLKGMWNKTIENIQYLSTKTYVSVGMVFTPDNVKTCVEDVLFADSLGVSDIRVIPSAQFNQALSKLTTLPKKILDKYPILRYRINNVTNGRHVRGLRKNDCSKCLLGIDDMAVANGKHFPCIIYMREQGDPIGDVTENIRQDRSDWIASHNAQQDPICSKNCLDVCIDYNNRANELKNE